MEDRLAKLHAECRKSEVRLQKLWGVIITGLCIGLQAFSGEVLFGALTLPVVGVGVWIVLNDKLMEG